MRCPKSLQASKVFPRIHHLEDEDKKMEDVDDFKSISSSDAKIDKDDPSKASEDGRELEIIEEKDEHEKEDIIMEEENEDFLSNNSAYF